MRSTYGTTPRLHRRNYHVDGNVELVHILAVNILAMDWRLWYVEAVDEKVSEQVYSVVYGGPNLVSDMLCYNSVPGDSVHRPVSARLSSHGDWTYSFYTLDTP